MGLSASLAKYKNKQLFTETEMYQTTLWCNTEKLHEINPMGLFYPWVDYKNKQFFTSMKIRQTTLRCNTKYLRRINPMVIGAPQADTYLHNWKLE